MITHLATGEFWAGAGERAARAFAWATLAALGVPALDGAIAPGGFDVRDVGWVTALSYGAGAAVLSLFFSVGMGQMGGPPGSASLVDDRPDPAELD